MKTIRVSPLLLVLALTGPVHAQDIGPGAMLDELTSLDEAAYPHDMRRGRGVGAASEASRDASKNAARAGDERHPRHSANSGSRSTGVNAALPASPSASAPNVISSTWRGGSAS